MHRELTLVFLPPGGGDTSGWGEHIAEFSLEYPTLAIDLPGAGTKRDQSPLDSLQECAAYVEGCLAASGAKDVALIGYSMGGLIAQLLAIRNPNQFKALVLVATAARIKIRQDILDALQDSPQEAKKLINQFARSPNSQLGTDDSVPTKAMFAYLSATNGYDARGRVNEITTPTLILHGDEDLTCPLKFGEWLNEQIPGSRLNVFSGAGHMLPQQFPGEMRQSIINFLDSL